jgi:hypothetical protein
LTTALNNLFFTGLSLLLLIVSIVLITRIHPSTKPPQLFKESTNLEMLMDLKTSVGIIDEISCSKCSAIYDVCYEAANINVSLWFDPTGT